jgi:hypothetical protein
MTFWVTLCRTSACAELRSCFNSAQGTVICTHIKTLARRQYLTIEAERNLRDFGAMAMWILAICWNGHDKLGSVELD